MISKTKKKTILLSALSVFALSLFISAASAATPYTCTFKDRKTISCGKRTFNYVGLGYNINWEGRFNDLPKENAVFKDSKFLESDNARYFIQVPIKTYDSSDGKEIKATLTVIEPGSIWRLWVPEFSESSITVKPPPAEDKAALEDIANGAVDAGKQAEAGAGEPLTPEEQIAEEAAKAAQEAANGAAAIDANEKESFTSKLFPGVVCDKQSSVLACWVNVVFNWSLIVVGSLAVLVISFGGVVYMTSAGNPDQISKAKGLILHALMGVGVLILAKFFIGILGTIL